MTDNQSARTAPAHRVISGYSSLILDGLRILAAFTVFFFHIYERFLPSGPYFFIFRDVAHLAVIVFFTLSGYVIAYTTTANNRGGKQYIQARFTRLFSIVFPALLITGLCEWIVKLTDPLVYGSIIRGASLPRYVMSGLFLNEIWFFSGAPPINAPLWSLGFEFWYYMIFGVWFFRGKSIMSWILCIGVCLVAGPKILLMMPIWLMGYAAYHIKVPAALQKTTLLLVASGLVLAVVVTKYLPPMPYTIGTQPWFFASQFISDWITGICVAFALWNLPQGVRKDSQKQAVKLLRNFADLTFPLYIIHLPVLYVYQALVKPDIHQGNALTITTIVVLAASLLISYALDKQRLLWSGFFKGLFKRLSFKI